MEGGRHIKMEIKMQHRKYYVGVLGVTETHTEPCIDGWFWKHVKGVKGTTVIANNFGAHWKYGFLHQTLSHMVQTLCVFCVIRS